MLELFITIVAGELKIERQPMGSTTWKRKKLKRRLSPIYVITSIPPSWPQRQPRHSRMTSTFIRTPTWPPRSISQRLRLIGRESTPRCKCRNSGAYAIRQSPSNSSVPMERIPRRSTAVSCRSRPRMSPGGSSPRIRAAWWHGNNAYGSGYATISSPSQTRKSVYFLPSPTGGTSALTDSQNGPSS